MTDEARCCAAARADADAAANQLRERMAEAAYRNGYRDGRNSTDRRWTAAVEGLAAELERRRSAAGKFADAIPAGSIAHERAVGRIRAYYVAAARLRGLTTSSEEQQW